MVQAGNTNLALDAHGGDRGLAVSVAAACAALAEDPRLHIILVGDQSSLEQELARQGEATNRRLEVHHAETVIAMDAKPAAILRRGRDSSLWKAFELVSSGQAAACVSGGNTAAMMIVGVKQLGLLPGIQRPALMAYVPNAHAYTGLLDLGANLSVTAQQLVQFAIMGSVTSELVEGVARPRVGLLNVGHEDSKGHELVQGAHDLLKALPVNYTGFIEGHDIFSGKVDVAVCDGFAGNLILKSTEGAARMLMDEVRSGFNDGLMARLGGLLAGASLRKTLARLDPAAHNGAPLLGLNGVAVKSHGGSDIKGMSRAIVEAGREARKQVPRRIEASIHEYHLESQS